MARLGEAARSREHAMAEHGRLLAVHEQWLVDMEVRETARAMIDATRLGETLREAFLQRSFLDLAGRRTVYQAIVDAAAIYSGASGVDLQVFDADTETLTIESHYGFSHDFLDAFRQVRVDDPTACAMSLRTLRPVLVHDVRSSPIFADRTTLQNVLDAGTTAVYSYPLLGPDRAPRAVLSFHHRAQVPQQATARGIARDAARVIAGLG